MHMWDFKCIYNFSLKTSREGTALQTYKQMWDNIKMDLKEIQYEGVDWSQLAQEEVQAGCCENSKGSLHSMWGELLDQLRNYQLLLFSVLQFL
jgi:hypothetical protein